MIDTILFDLDGTLISFDQDEFLDLYYKGIAKKFLAYGYQKDILLNALFEGVLAMLKNDGSKTNEHAFWDRFTHFIPDNLYFFENTFIDYYNNEYQEIKKIIKDNKFIHLAIEELKRKNYKLVIATNPLFPFIATKSRIEWGNLNVDDYKLVTTFENSSYCKPNLAYYQEILGKINKSANQCLMVGNDVSEDMIVGSIGMDTYLITDNIINNENIDINKYKHGNYEAFYEFVKGLPTVKN